MAWRLSQKDYTAARRDKLDEVSHTAARWCSARSLTSAPVFFVAAYIQEGVRDSTGGVTNHRGGLLLVNNRCVAHSEDAHKKCPVFCTTCSRGLTTFSVDTFFPLAACVYATVANAA